MRNEETIIIDYINAMHDANYATNKYASNRKNRCSDS